MPKTKRSYTKNWFQMVRLTGMTLLEQLQGIIRITPTKKYDAVFIITDGNPTTVKQKGRLHSRTATDFLSLNMLC